MPCLSQLPPGTLNTPTILVLRRLAGVQRMCNVQAVQHESDWSLGFSYQLPACVDACMAKTVYRIDRCRVWKYILTRNTHA
jgi:hypothetical protein